MPDLFDLLPALNEVDHLLLKDQEIRLVGVSAILYDEENYYFEIAQPRYWGKREDKTRSVGIGGIGGGIKAGETLLGCLRRKVEEELGTGFTLESGPSTALIQQGEVIASLDLPPSEEESIPSFINLMPPQLAGPGMPDHLAIVTYQGRLEGKPRRDDLFGMLTVGRSALGTFFEREEWQLEEALAHPALTFDLASDLPQGCVLQFKLTGRAFRVLHHHQKCAETE